MSFLHPLLPWDPAPAVIAACAGAGLLYVAGLARGARPGGWRLLGFCTGLALMYAVMQTRLDYYGQYLFAAHRGQHLVLHHLAPFLIAWSAPVPVFVAALAGTPLANASASPAMRPLLRLYRALQTPWVAGVLFVGLIYLWLIPSVHFFAMLDRRLYWLMNLSMAVDGLLFWWLVFARERDGATPHLSLGGRLLLLVLILPPQALLGAGIALSERTLFEIYDLCGRALPLAPLDDQHIGGLLTWLPPVMMSMAAATILLAQRLGGWRDDETMASARIAAPKGTLP